MLCRALRLLSAPCKAKSCPCSLNKSQELSRGPKITAFGQFNPFYACKLATQSLLWLIICNTDHFQGLQSPIIPRSPHFSSPQKKLTFGSEAKICCLTSHTRMSDGYCRHFLTFSSGTKTRMSSVPGSGGWSPNPHGWLLSIVPELFSHFLNNFFFFISFFCVRLSLFDSLLCFHNFFYIYCPFDLRFYAFVALLGSNRNKKIF